MNILTFSSLYPNKVDPSHGIFVERRLRRLVDNMNATASVVAPVPWFPFRSSLFGRYAEFAAVPERDTRNGIDVRYPRFPLLPKIGMLSAPANMARATATVIRQLIADKGAIDIIDAHYFYPDGVAASRLADRFGLPFIVTARGSDINTIATIPKPRQMILEAAAKAEAVIAVSDSLRRSLEQIGVNADKIHVMRNGVDLTFFQPGDRVAARRKLEFQSPTVVSVGALKEAKGHDVAIESLRHLGGVNLVVIGAGGYEGQLRKLVRSLDLASRVTFAGRLGADDLLTYYQAADALFLMSRREGMPNVVLESLACGTPVIAADVGGIGEIVDSPVMGQLLADRTPQALAKAWQALLDRGTDRAAVRRAAERLSWDETIESLSALMRSCCRSDGN